MPAELYLYNTLTRQKELFTPLNPPLVTMYSCGPTVYDYAHIGHMRHYVTDDILIRALRVNGYQVKKVMNITDVGHLVSEDDFGEDKVDKRAREEGRHPLEIAKKYEAQFFASTDKLNVARPDVVCRATDYIEEQINLVKVLLEKGFAYQTKEAIYFDVAKFPSYTALSQQSLEDKLVGVRKEVYVDSSKKNPPDFVLWYFLTDRYKDHILQWASPWGAGFPGWHIECSAMALAHLGETLDIHRGGVDHISVHHTNERAQSEAATGKKFVNYWVHHEFLNIQGDKMSKSTRNFYRVQDLEKKGFDPLALRYLFLTSHYRSHMDFTWEALEGAQKALNKLRRFILDTKNLDPANLADVTPYTASLLEAINDDLNTAQALAIVWKLLDAAKSDSGQLAVARDVLLEADKVLGLDLSNYQRPAIPSQVQDLVTQRKALRQAGKFEEADAIRDQVLDLGYQIEDTGDGSQIIKA